MVSETSPLQPPTYEPVPAQEDTMGRNDHHLSLESRAGDAIAFKTVLAGAGVFVAAAWTVVLSNHPSSLGWFAPHPILQSTALAFFTYAIFTLQPTAQPTTKAAGLVRHQLANLTGVPLIMLGAFSIWYKKEKSEWPHFTTWHGTFGSLCLCWLVVQAFIGAGSVWFGGALFGGGTKAKLVWKYHRASGYLLFTMLIFTAHLGGAWSSWSVGSNSFALRLLGFTIAPLVILVSVYSRIRLSKMNFRQ